MPANTDSKPETQTVRRGIPRAVEFLLAGLGLLVCLPLLLVAGIAIKLTSDGPVLFRQQRLGRNGKAFTLYKMRTMRKANSGAQVTASDDARVTPAGRLLRKTKVDELPELWNIIKGDMSLVGPRPEVPRYVDLNNRRWQRVLTIRPGITDPMTLRLRNEEELLANVQGDHEEFYRTVLQPYKLNGYLAYLQERSWWNDVKILFGTLAAVIIPSRMPAPTVNEITSESLKY
jgi:lipopolysaccharide/colanic/teichoic acid biosynthesis glycosyltransferase